MCVLRVRLFACLTLCDPMDCGPPGSSVHGIPRQEYWSGLPFPSPGDLPDPGIEPRSPALQADSLPPSRGWGQPQEKASLGFGFRLISQSLGPTLQCANLTLPSLRPGLPPSPAWLQLGSWTQLSCFCAFFYSNNSSSSFRLISISASWSPCSLSP